MSPREVGRDIPMKDRAHAKRRRGQEDWLPPLFILLSAEDDVWAATGFERDAQPAAKLGGR